ncbi:MAG TPA: imidazole glycerol phosphate synthase cyclase subunit [bacterium]|nr:imidazole glycerol phosphate synthase cyclase subunit [bacterium]
MLKKRLIPVLVIRDGAVVQSIGFQHTNVIHWKPVTAVDFFNKWAVDEIIVVDVARNQDQRDKFYTVVDGFSRKCFVPLTVGGWVTSTDEMRKLLRLGADKVAINTEAVRRPEFITECATIFGNQCVVVSIDSKRNEQGVEEVCIDRGREPTGLETAKWAREAQERGAGEIFLNSIDHDGCRKGYNLDLIRKVVEAVDIPVIAMGGVQTWEHLVEGIIKGGADAVAAANIFHYTEHSTKKAKAYMRQAGIDVR